MWIRREIRWLATAHDVFNFTHSTRDCAELRSCFAALLQFARKPLKNVIKCQTVPARLSSTTWRNPLAPSWVRTTIGSRRSAAAIGVLRCMIVPVVAISC